MQNRYAHIQWETLKLPGKFPDIASMGGFVLFAGVVRNLNQGREVHFLEYEAYAPMADSMIQSILSDARSHWELEQAYCIHRLGRLEIGEAAVLVSTGSMHRDEAYRANRYIIDRVKHEVPIWKREHFADGSSEWSVGCEHIPEHEHRSHEPTSHSH